jgi:hypothetical protein
MAKFTVITAIFGNYDCLRDNQHQNKDVDYLCITDNPNLKSNTWKIIVNPEQINPDWSPRKKTYYVRYHLFEFCNTPNAIWMDASIELQDVSKILTEFDAGILSILYLGGYQFKSWFKKFSMFGDECHSIDYMDDEYFLFYYNKIQNLLEYIKNNKINTNDSNFRHINGRLRMFKNTSDNIKLMNDCWELLNSEDLMKNQFNIKRGKNENFYDIYYYDEIVFGLFCKDVYLAWNYNYNEFPFIVYNHNTYNITH